VGAAAARAAQPAAESRGKCAVALCVQVLILVSAAGSPGTP
jgi:hypothetical protein